jgi:UDP-2,3-diacylglucosamine pyrophosphatase LpxH
VRYSVFTLSDVHIGDKHSLATPKVFLNEEQRIEGGVSDAQRRAVIQGIERNVRAANVVVIDGDLIDGYSLARKELHAEKTFAYTMGMLERWCEKYPNKQFYYALGNHCGDVNIEKREDLLALSHIHPNLHVNDYGVIIGDTLFMHGDLPHQNDAFELSHRGKKGVYREEVSSAHGNNMIGWCSIFNLLIIKATFAYCATVKMASRQK